MFGQILRHDFINYDDDAYVYDNPAVVKGLTAEGFAAAFRETDLYLWTPLTRLSHMLVVELVGLQPWGHHLTNLLLHTATAILLFLVLRKMTGALWRSAFVAAVFAIHPLHVESVAWVSERKDTLSALFFALTLLTYLRNLDQPSSRWRYSLLAGVFALGLLAKPMLVTLPFLLLLLDYWPLRRVEAYRLRPADWWPLLVEKLPLFLLAGLSLALTLFDPFGMRGSPQTPVNPPSFLLRLSNGIVSYAVYIWKMFWPTDLSVRYPFPSAGIPVLHVLVSLAFLGAVTALVWWQRTRRSYLFVGWFWYLGMLLPVSQIMTLGSEARCDRYTYLPQIGLYICIAWGVADLLRSWRYGRIIAATATVPVLLTLMVIAHAQAAHWKNSATLWSHVVATASPDPISYNYLGFSLAAQNPLSDDAIKYYNAALALQPRYAEAHNNLGRALAARGRWDEAMRCYEETLRLKPNYVYAEHNAGLALAQKGELQEAARRFEQALRLKPSYAEARHNYVAAHVNLGMLFAAQGKVEDAIARYDAALKVEPDFLPACNNLAWLLATHPSATIRNGARAVQLAENAARLAGPDDPKILDTLAAAYAEAGDYAKATATANRAAKLARSAADHELAARLEERSHLYRRQQPYRAQE